MSKRGTLKSGLLGVIIGSIAGVLFAPKAGKETRKDIKDAAKKAGAEAEKQLKEMHGQLASKIDDLADRTKEAKGASKNELQKLGERAESVKDRVSEAISTLRAGESSEEETAKALKEAQDTINEIAKKVKKK